LAKTYARNKKLLSLRSITNGLQQTGLLVACTYRASVHLDPPPTAAMIANDQFASPTDLEMTSAFALGRHEPCAVHVRFQA
jgi:hypothetical protein